MSSYCGYIALVGRPNVGKSTLLNKLVKQKISITSTKAQTTRHSIIGVATASEYQFIFVDTPGIHHGVKKELNRLLNKAARKVLQDVDLILFLVSGTEWTEEDEYVLSLIKRSSLPCILLINKVDKIKSRDILLPYLEKIRHVHNFAAIIPISAKTGLQIDVLQNDLKPYVPSGPHLFPPDDCTDRSLPFLCGELLREKIFRFCGQELPYSVAVEIESFKDVGKLIKIHALIIINKANHKQMIIGENGQKLKTIATKARLDMEKLLEKKVYLECWCKVKPGWVDDKAKLKQLGYDNI